MSGHSIRLGEGLDLPAEQFVESKGAIIGQSGRGKSGLLKVIQEELVKNELPFVVFDPAGVAWGLRSSLDGKGPGLPCLVIGGSHGDLPLNRKAGAEVAVAIVDANVSVIIDFSDEPKAAYREFVRDFSQQLYAASAHSTSPRLVLIDEAKEVVPQMIRPDMTQTYDAVERLVRQGRNRGIGVVLASQRAATVNKDVLTQCGWLAVFGLVGKQDRKALQEWVSAKGTEEQLEKFEKSLAGLERRECWFWSPEEFRKFQKVRVRDFETFHPDRTHLRREGLLQVQPSTIDVSSVVGKLGVTFARIKEERIDLSDAKRLRLEVERLKRELDNERASTRSPAVGSAEIRRKVAEAEKPLRDELSRLSQENRARANVIGKVRKVSEMLVAALGGELLPGSAPAPPIRTESPPRQVIELKVRDQSETAEGVARPTGGALRMLHALVTRHPESLRRDDLGVLGEIAPNSGTFTDYLSLLRRNGFIQELSDGSIAASPAGQAYVGEADRLTADRVQSSALSRVSGGARRMLERLIQVYPSSLTRQELAERSQISPGSGTFSDYLSMLRRLGFVESEGQEVRAREVLFT